jgi:Mce-associated membrane protein
MSKDKAQLVIGALASLLLMSLVALLVVWQVDSGSGSPGNAGALMQAGKDADAAARKAVVRMTTYDYRTVEKDFDWVDDAGTAKFRDQYTEVSEPIRKLVTELKATAKGTVVDSAPRVEDTRHVTVLLFVDQEISNPGSGSTKPQRGLDQPRVVMKMVEQDGRWLVDEVELSNLNEKG